VIRKGLGKFLMQILELIGKKTQMRSISLTVQSANTGAMEFYTRALKYNLDDFSPSKADPLRSDSYGYEILTKDL